MRPTRWPRRSLRPSLSLAEPAEEAPVVDPLVEFRRQMSALQASGTPYHLPGYERRVAADIMARAENFEVEDYIFDATVPMETINEIKNGNKKKGLPCASPATFVRMDLMTRRPGQGAAHHQTPLPDRLRGTATTRCR